ncbi:hypothetical protein ABEB36_001862 [Hypothenemus hampei]|uniref:Suppressor APC domain-containing protein n=1 Tax=Hypothenemus hampei TaxID=57062 RepID=A0ABD1FJ49_HYPHA
MSSTLDNLPKPFVTAMRTLFDIMDDKKTGFVNLSDIEARWQEDSNKALPKGVLESLRKVTPSSGLLSFERFCAGLKISLLRNQMENRQQSQQQQHQQQEHELCSVANTNRPPSAPLLDLDINQGLCLNNKSSWGSTKTSATIRPNNSNSQQQQNMVVRTLSMPQLKDGAVAALPNIEHLGKTPPLLFGPPKPPRSAIMERNNVIDRAEIRTALANWQMGLLTNNQLDTVTQKDGKRPMGNGNATAINNSPTLLQQNCTTGLLRPSRSLGDGKAEVPNHTILTMKKTNARNRREPRRHTLQNGIDYNMLKRMKQIEQEKDVLMTGLGAVEKARDWYLKQVTLVQEKMKYLGRMGHLEPWSETQQERLELQRARVLEVNRHLAALTESWERGGLPLHMNLAVHHYPMSQDLTDRLKQQNRMLTEEIGKKSDRIVALEREKASLIQVLQMQPIRNHGSHNNGNEEAVF